MKSMSVYELASVLADQGDSIREQLTALDTALDSFDAEGVKQVNENLLMLASAMSFIAEEVSEDLEPTARDYDAEADDFDYPNEDYPW